MPEEDLQQSSEQLKAIDDTVKACVQGTQYSAEKKLFFIGSSDIASSLLPEIKASVFDPEKGKNAQTSKWRKRKEAQFIELQPSLIISYLGDQNYTFEDLAEYYFVLDKLAATGCGVVHFDKQFTSRWNHQFRLPVYHCRGNVSFATNIGEMIDDIKKLFGTGARITAPKNNNDIGSNGFKEPVMKLHIEAELTKKPI